MDEITVELLGIINNLAIIKTGIVYNWKNNTGSLSLDFHDFVETKHGI
jgi:hypothetical protein